MAADSADNDLDKVRSISFSSEYCGIRKRIEKMNRGKVMGRRTSQYSLHFSMVYLTFFHPASRAFSYGTYAL